MEGSEESPVHRVPPVDRVSARTRGSRPVGPPPPSNLFDVPPLGGYEHETATPRVKRKLGETAQTQIHVNYSNFPNVLGELLCTIG